jgi:riboflavin synthase
MFTGLVTAVGSVTHLADTPAGREVGIAAPFDDVVAGESIAVDGACLTVRERAQGHVTVAAVQTTLERTHLATWTAGRRVNLERAVAVGDRLGGHLVQGHVDGVGQVVAARQAGDAWLLDVALPAGHDGLLVPHGSIAVDGVSLTVHALPAPGVVGLSIIEYTARQTTLGARRPGDPVHIEFDTIGKYVRGLIAPWQRAFEEAAPGART